jgi:acyl carrier protein
VRSGGVPLLEQVGQLSAAKRRDALVDLVRAHAAAVLGHADAGAVDLDQGLLDLGFDSLMAVEFRNQLGTATGLPLATTLVFDHPSVAAVADHLVSLTGPGDGELPALSEIDRLEALLTAASADAQDRDKITERLQALLWKWRDLHGSTDGTSAPDDLDEITDDEMFEALDKELGLS